MSLVEEFRAAMAEGGVPTDARLIPDGKLHRVYVDGDARGSRNGYYTLHLDERPAGMFGSWRTGASGRWHSGRAIFDAARRAEWAAMIARATRERDEQRAQDAAGAVELASAEWANAGPVDCRHPYVVRKAIQPKGLRQLGADLLVPLRDSAAVLRGVQRIAGDGRKLFTKGMAKRGTYFSVGKPAGVLVVVEGAATGLTVHVATGLPVACAMDCGNLSHVAKALRAKYPTAEFILAADSDARGLESAEAAVKAIGGGVVLAPNLTEGEGTDWNDLAACRGLERVRACFAEHAPVVWRSAA